LTGGMAVVFADVYAVGGKELNKWTSAFAHDEYLYGKYNITSPPPRYRESCKIQQR